MLCWAWGLEEECPRGPAVCWHVQGQSPQQADMRDAAQDEMELLLTSVLPRFSQKARLGLSRGPGDAGVFQSAGLQNRGLTLFPGPLEVRGPRCREGCPLDTWLGAQPLGAKARKVSPPLWASPEGGRKEVMQDRISPSQGCNLPAPIT